MKSIRPLTPTEERKLLRFGFNPQVERERERWREEKRRRAGWVKMREYHVITDEATVRSCGRLSDVCYGVDYEWEDLAFCLKEIALLADVERCTVQRWISRGIMPGPMFRAYVYNIPKPGQGVKGHWQNAYLLAEVLVILRYVRRAYQRTVRIRSNSLEVRLMAEELEATRSEIKRRLHDGIPGNGLGELRRRV